MAVRKGDQTKIQAGIGFFFQKIKPYPIAQPGSKEKKALTSLLKKKTCSK
jgi:hypothetical protein